MNKLTWHIPASIEVDKHPEPVVFDTLEDLLALERIEALSSYPSFHRFSIARDKDGCMLMFEEDDGYHWWVIGYLSSDIPELPTWEAKYK